MSKTADSIRKPSTSVTLESVATLLDTLNDNVAAKRPKILYCEAEDTNNLNSTSATDLFSESIAANLLIDDAVLRVTAWGYTGLSTNNITLTMSYGGNDVMSDVIASISTNFVWRVDGVIQADDSGTSQQSFFSIKKGSSDSWNGANLSGVQAEEHTGVTTSTTATSAQDFNITAQNSAAGATLGIYLKSVIIELL